MGVFVLLSLTYFEATHTDKLKAIMEYLECQLSGFHPELEGEDQCGEIPIVQHSLFDVLSAVGTFQFVLVPVVILVFTVKCTGKYHC